MIRIDGSMESLLIVLTGADVRVNEDQLHYLDAKQCHVIQKMRQAIDKLNDSLDELENMNIPTTPYDIATFKEFAERQQRAELLQCRTAQKVEITCQLRTEQAAKNTYLAHQRSARVREAFLQLYRQVYCNVSKKKETKSFFSCLTRDPKLTAYEDAARGLVEHLKDIIYATRQTPETKIHDYVNKLERALQIEAKNAAENSLGIIKTLGSDFRYQTYRAIMRRDGEWRTTDLNEDLVDGMLDGTVSSVWHQFFNDFLKSELESLITAIRDHHDVTIQSIKDRAKRKPKQRVGVCIEKKSDGIRPLGMLKPAKSDYLLSVQEMQREFGGSFKGLLRDKLEVHYRCVARQSGTGMFQRMKDINEKKFSGQDVQELYAELVDEVMSAIRKAITKGENALDTALAQLYSYIEHTFVYTQDDDTMNKNPQKKMRIFLEEEYGKPLAELTIIADMCKERNTTPVDSEATAITGQGVSMVQ
ncbi:hypothetical protein BDR04DRAFT_1178393 [Suillus decipiens]|nr:hypothetical protein BDR04DRAFT_1178393 [Suillus decipiens]